MIMDDLVFCTGTIFYVKRPDIKDVPILPKRTELLKEERKQILLILYMYITIIVLFLVILLDGISISGWDHLIVDTSCYSLCIQLWILCISIPISDGLGTAENQRRSKSGLSYKEEETMPSPAPRIAPS